MTDVEKFGFTRETALEMGNKISVMPFSVFADPKVGAKLFNVVKDILKFHTAEYVVTIVYKFDIYLQLCN